MGTVVAVGIRRTMRGDCCGYVQCRVAIEEADRFEHKATAIHRHHRPVLRAREMRDAEGVPHDDVRTVNAAPLFDVRWQPAAARMLVRQIARGISLRRIVGGHPQMLSRERGAAGDRRRRVCRQDRLALRI